MTRATENLTRLLAKRLRDVPAMEGLAPQDQKPGALINVYEQTTFGDRKLEGAATDITFLWLIVCSNNDAVGASILAQEVAELLDGASLDDSVIRVELTTTPVRDVSDPQHEVWSATVSARLVQSRKKEKS